MVHVEDHGRLQRTVHVAHGCRLSRNWQSPPNSRCSAAMASRDSGTTSCLPCMQRSASGDRGALRTACKGGAETPPQERQPNARDGLGETPLEGTVLTRQFADAGRPRRGVRGP